METPNEMQQIAYLSEESLWNGDFSQLIFKTPHMLEFFITDLGSYATFSNTKMYLWRGSKNKS